MFLQQQINASINDDNIKKYREKGIIQIQIAITFIIFGMLGALYVEIADSYDQGPMRILAHVKFPCLAIVMSTIMKILLKKYTGFSKYAPLILCSFLIVNVTEREIFLSPDQFNLPTPTITLIAISEYFNVVLFTSQRNKLLQNAFMWSYFVLRNYQQYNHIPLSLILDLFILQFSRFQVGKIFDSYTQSITQLYQSQNKIMNDCFKSTLDLIPNGILVINIHNSQISFANKEIMNILGICDYVEIQNKLKEFYLNESQQTNQQIMSSIQNSSGRLDLKLSDMEKPNKINLWEYLLSCNHQSSNQQKIDAVFKMKNPKIYIQIKKSIINDDSQILCICSDITRIQELQQTTYKMRSMFFSSIAHELRTPLNSIIPLIKIVQTMSKDSHILKFLKIILNSSIHLQNVIEDALDMSRIENGKFQIFKEQFDIRKAVDEVCQIMEFQIQQKNLHLTIDISESVPDIIYSDSKRYKQILFNLIGNAVKFTFRGGITVKIQYENNYLISEVIDTGIGIQVEWINKLFKFFGQIAKSKHINRGGMGLGLTISKMIVQQLNGEISVQSAHQMGSNFTFKILIDNSNRSDDLIQVTSQINFQSHESRPIGQHDSNMTNNQQEEELKADYEYWDLRDSDNGLCSPAEAYQETLTQRLSFKFIESNTVLNTTNMRKYQVLIVDDSSYNLFVLEELLKQIGNHIQISKAMNGQEALEQINQSLSIQNKCPYDFIFLDLHMPILDGFQTIEILRDMHVQKQLNLDDTLVIALSALTEHQFNQSRNKILFDKYMEKPLNYEELKRLFRADDIFS